MADIKLHYIKLRPQPDGTYRPRFTPGPRERAQGFAGVDLKHPDGRWFTREEAIGWSEHNYQSILAQRRSGKRLKAPPTVRGTLVDDLLEDFLGSADFLRPREAGGYSDNGRADYRAKANAIRYRPRDRSQRSDPRELEPFAQTPVSAIGKPEVKDYYLYLCRVRGATMARGAIMVLSAAFQWASMADRWRLKHNPCHELDLPTPMPRIRIASDTEIRALMASADRPDVNLPEVGDAIYLALFTGQRQRDVLDLVPAEQGARNRFRQSKTGAIVSIPETPALTARLARAAERRARMHNTVIDTTVVIYAPTGRRFNTSTFKHNFADVRAKAVAGDVERSVAPCPSLGDFHYQDLRDTSVTWYARSGCTVPEIASITGHSMRSIYTILKHYLALDEHLADAAVAKLVAWMEKTGVAV